MATKHGTIGEFDKSQEDWQAYVERVNLYLIANDVTDPIKKRAILLSVCGTKTYHTIRNLVAPESPTELEYDAIVKLVQEYYNPKPVVTVQRYKFNSSSRESGETVAMFVAELRRLAIYCDYGEFYILPVSVAVIPSPDTYLSARDPSVHKTHLFITYHSPTS